MSKRPYFSLFGPAIRPKFYKDAYNSVSNGNEIPFEIVFAGHKPPAETMPDNFRYIYCEESKSPCQCWDIAARESKGVLMISSGDDIRYSKNFLNRAYYYSTIFDLDKTLISFRYRFQWGSDIPKVFLYNGVSLDEGSYYDFGDIYSSVVIGASGLYRKDLWIKLGGLDSRFYGSFADIDMMLRYYYELGMKFFIPPDCLIIEFPIDSKPKTNLIYRSDPTELLNSLWVKEGTHTKERTSPVESFEYE